MKAPNEYIRVKATLSEQYLWGLGNKKSTPTVLEHSRYQACIQQSGYCTEFLVPVTADAEVKRLTEENAMLRAKLKIIESVIHATTERGGGSNDRI